MSQGHHANDHQHPTAQQTHEDEDKLFAASQQATAEELGWRPLEPAALVLASQQRRIEPGLFLA